MSTKAVDQGQALAEQIAKIVSKVHQSVGTPETTDEIESDVAYSYIQYLEGRKMFHKELRICEKRKWAYLLTLLPYARKSAKQFLSVITELDVFLKKPLLEI